MTPTGLIATIGKFLSERYPKTRNVAAPEQVLFAATMFIDELEKLADEDDD